MILLSIIHCWISTLEPVYLFNNVITLIAEFHVGPNVGESLEDNEKYVTTIMRSHSN